jgi:hypothetical protein
MALEALVGGKHLQLLLDFVLTSGSLPLTTTTLSQMSLIGTITLKRLGTAWWRQQTMVTPTASKLLSWWSWSN